MSKQAGATSRQSEYERDLCKIIQLISFYEDKLEQMKISLVECARFDVILLFQKIAKGSQGITSNHFRAFFAQNQFPVLGRDCDYLIFQAGGSERQMLLLEDFCRIFLVTTNPTLKRKIEDQFTAFLLAQEQGLFSPVRQLNQSDIPFFIEGLVVKYFALEIKRFSELEAAKTLFTTKFGSDLLLPFKNISNKGHTFNVIERVMRKNKYAFQEEQFESLMKRIDVNNDRQISKEEFLDERFILPNYQFSVYAQAQKQNDANQMKNKQGVCVLNSGRNSFSTGNIGTYYYNSNGKVYQIQEGRIEETRPQGNFNYDPNQGSIQQQSSQFQNNFDDQQPPQDVHLSANFQNFNTQSYQNPIYTSENKQRRLTGDNTLQKQKLYIDNFLINTSSKNNNNNNNNNTTIFATSANPTLNDVYNYNGPNSAQKLNFNDNAFGQLPEQVYTELLQQRFKQQQQKFSNTAGVDGAQNQGQKFDLASTKKRNLPNTNLAIITEQPNSYLLQSGQGESSPDGVGGESLDEINQVKIQKQFQPNFGILSSKKQN